MAGQLAAVLGTGQTKYVAKRQDVSMNGLVREAIDKALSDSGSTMADIDAVVVGKAPDFFEGVMMPELFMADAAVDTDVVRSRAPRTGVSMRCSIPVIHAGFFRSSRALSPAASTIAAAPSVIGAMSWRRRGSAKYGRDSSSSMLFAGFSESVRWATANESSAT